MLINVMVECEWGTVEVGVSLIRAIERWTRGQWPLVPNVSTARLQAEMRGGVGNSFLLF